MGVKLFISWVRRRCPTALKRPPRVDHLYIDANCIVHQCAQRVYGYGECGARPLVPRGVEHLYDAVWCRLLEIVADARPRKSLYVAFDGVAPAAKEATQRARRHAPTPRTTRFDPNELTAGTEFMRAMCVDVRRRCERAFKACVVSDADAPGEGEQKIMARVLAASTTVFDAHCVYSVDSDVVIAGLLAVEWRPFLTVMRDEGEYIDIRHLRRRLGIAVVDFVILTFLVGNDFVPAMRGVTVDTLDELVAALDGSIGAESASPLGSLRPRSTPASTLTTCGGVIDARAIGRIFRVMDVTRSGPSGKADPNPSGEADPGPTDAADQERYLNQPRDDDVAYNYIKTMQWNLDYYTRAGVGASWTWKYPNVRAPSRYQIASLGCDTSAAPLEFCFPTDDGPPTIGDYLASLLPLRNLALVPVEYHDACKRYNGVVPV
jgi:5'-3' exonuclease